MTPSFAFVRERETNGVADRFIRTLKERLSKSSRNTPELDGRNDSQPTRSHDAALCPKNRVGTPGTTSARLARPLEERAGCQPRFATRRYVRGQSTFVSGCLAFSIP
jgi:hypothetical protein